MTPRERERLRHFMTDHGCAACFKIGVPGMPPDMDHPNLDDKAGQKRISDDIFLPLCPWHHRGVTLNGFNSTQMRERLGPSKALAPRAFRNAFGTREELRAEVLDRVRIMADMARGAA